MKPDFPMNSSNETKTPTSTSDKPAAFFPNRSSGILFAFVVVLFAVSRLWRLTASCLWFDEIFSVHAARHKWPELLHFVAADIIHPPLFYALLKVWISVGGESLLWLRLLPALISIAAIVPIYLLCRELRVEWRAATLTLLFMAVNGYLIKYAQELRMYSLLFFLSLLSLWLFVRFLKAGGSLKKELLALFGINLLLVYTHYAGWLSVGLEAVAVLLWNRARLRTFVVGSVAIGLAYVPWLYEVKEVSAATHNAKGLAQNIGWVTRPYLMDVLQYFTLLNKPFFYQQGAIYDSWNTLLAIVLIGLPFAAFTWQAFRHRENEDGTRQQTVLLLFLFVFAPAILIFLLSWIFHYSIWGTRHLIISAGPYSILAALAVLRLRPYWIKISVCLVLGCWFGLAGIVFLFSRPTSFIWCAWEPLAEQMMSVEADSKDAVEVYAYEDLVAYHLWFVLDTDNRKRFKVSVIKGVSGIFDDPAYFLPRDFVGISLGDPASLQGDHIWVAFRTQQWDEKSPPIDYLVRSGYHVARVLEKPAQGQKAFLVELRRN